MQNYSNLTSLNFSYFAKPLIQLEPYQELVRLATTLQEVTFKQQVLLNALVIKQQQIEEKLKSSEKAKEKEHIELKQELSGTLAKTSEDQNSDIIKARKNGEEDLKVSRKPQITRRNGFKPIKRAAKLTDDNWNSDDEESFSGSEKSYKGRKNPSKAKHLWVNYGRRIIDYGVSQTKGDVQEKIKELTGKLTTKKDFEKVFEVEPKDPEEDKTFKKLLGKLAIYFVRNEAVLSFEGSKYRDEMINQRHIVAAWLERLISK